MFGGVGEDVMKRGDGGLDVVPYEFGVGTELLDLGDVERVFKAVCGSADDRLGDLSAEQFEFDRGEFGESLNLGENPIGTIQITAKTETHDD